MSDPRPDGHRCAYPGCMRDPGDGHVDHEAPIATNLVALVGAGASRSALLRSGERVLRPEALAVADEIDDAIPGLPDLAKSRADADRAQARMRHVGEQLCGLVALAREGGTDAVLTYLEAMSVGERTVLLAAAVSVMAEAER